jgi:medium-chain acyl-[acyl-carrier-protein] hydrolase
MYEMRVVPRPADCGISTSVSIKSLLDIIEDAAEHHAASVGDPTQKGIEGRIFWIRREWQIKLGRPIGIGEPINVKTWTIDKGATAISQRQFLVTAEDGKVLCRTNSTHAMFDYEKNRPVRISKELLDLYNPQNHYVLEPCKTRLRVPETFEYEKSFKLRRSDFDYNGHVHNTTYVDFAMEILPEEIYSANTFEELRIVYLKPVLKDSRVILRYSRIEEASDFASETTEEQNEIQTYHYVTVFADGEAAAIIKMR